MDTKLMALIHDVLGSRGLSEFDPNSLSLTDSLKEAYSSITHLPIFELRERATALKAANNVISPCFRLFDLGASEMTGYLEWFLKIKPLLFAGTKLGFVESLLSNESRDSSTPDVYLHRLRDGFDGTDRRSYRHTVFGQLFRQLKSRPASFWQRSKGSRNWKVNFVGEYAYDAGGPYRESMSIWCDEVSSPEKLSLVVWTPNHVSNTGLNKDCVLLNPKATHPTQLELFEFLGRMIGAAFYSKHPLPLRFPPLFWKQLVQDPLTLADLKDIDSIGHQQLNDFAYYIPEDMVFVTNLPDGAVVELIPGGKKVSVDETNIQRYIELATHAKLNASALQMSHLLKGLGEVVPISLLRLLTWTEVQEMVCGAPDFDVEMLKSTTDVEGSIKGTPTETHFWNTLKGFTPAERTKFLRFAWGQGTILPSSNPNFKPMTLSAITGVSDPSNAFPKSATCFFKISIPLYTSEEDCRRQLLYAINNCVSIDTDGSVVTAQASDDDEDEGI